MVSGYPASLLCASTSGLSFLTSCIVSLFSLVEVRSGTTLPPAHRALVSHTACVAEYVLLRERGEQGRWVGVSTGSGRIMPGVVPPQKGRAGFTASAPGAVHERE